MIATFPKWKSMPPPITGTRPTESKRGARCYHGQIGLARSIQEAPGSSCFDPSPPFSFIVLSDCTKNFFTPSPRRLPWCLSKKIETQYPRVVETLGFSVSVTCDRRVRLLVVVVVGDREWGGSFTSFHESGSERKRKKVTHYLLVVFRLRFLLIRLLLQLFSPSFLFIYFASFIPLFFFFRRRRIHTLGYCCDEQIDSNHLSRV